MISILVLLYSEDIIWLITISNFNSFFLIKILSNFIVFISSLKIFEIVYLSSIIYRPTLLSFITIILQSETVYHNVIFHWLK